MLPAFVSVATSECTYGTQSVNLQGPRDPAPKLIGNTELKLHGLSSHVCLFYRKLQTAVQMLILSPVVWGTVFNGALC